MYYSKLFEFFFITDSHDGLLELKDNEDLYQSVWTGIDIRCVLVIEDIYLLFWLNCILYIQMDMTRINKHSGHNFCYILYTLNNHVDLKMCPRLI